MTVADVASAAAPRPGNRPRPLTRRGLLGVGALALAGAALSGRVAEGGPRAIGGVAMTSVARRQRLRIALTDQQAAKIGPLLLRFEGEHDTSLEVTALPAAELYALLAVELLHETQSIDVVCLSDDWIASLGRSAVLVSGGVLISSETTMRLHEQVVGLGRSLDDQRLVAAPWTVDVGFTAVNGSAIGMTTVPRRWDELAELAERAGSSSLVLAGASGDVAATTFRAILTGFGTDIVEPSTNRPTVTDYDARRAMSVMRRLQATSSVSPLAVDDRVLRDLLAQGAATSCPHVWASTWLDAGAPTGWDLLPPLRASNPRASHLLRAWLLAIPRTAADVALSRTFVEFMLRRAVQRSMLDFGLIPSCADVVEDPDVKASQPAVAAIVRALGRSMARPRLRSFPEINRVCGEAVATILAGNASAGAAFRAASTEMRRVLEREGELRL